MKDKPKVNGFPSLVCGGNKYPGFKTLEQLEGFVKNGSFPEPVKRDSTCEQKLNRLENKVKQRRFDFWVYADFVKVIPGKDKIKDKIIFSKIRSCAKYQVYNEFNKELNKNRIITKLTPCELNKQLNNSLGPNWIPTCYMEYERCSDNKLRSFAFDLEKSRLCNGNLIFEVNLSDLDGNPEYLTKLNKPETGHHSACNIDNIDNTGTCNVNINVCNNNDFCFKEYSSFEKKSICRSCYYSWSCNNTPNGKCTKTFAGNKRCCKTVKINDNFYCRNKFTKPQ